MAVYMWLAGKRLEDNGETEQGCQRYTALHCTLNTCRQTCRSRVSAARSIEFELSGLVGAIITASRSTGVGVGIGDARNWNWGTPTASWACFGGGLILGLALPAVCRVARGEKIPLRH